MKLLCKKTARGRVLICSTILTLLFLFPSCNNAFEESARLKKSLKQQTQEQSKEQKEQIEILESDDGFKYSVAGRSVAIYGLSDQTDRVHLVIPAKIDGKPVTEIAEKAFYEEKAIFSVEFPESLEKIGPYAFYGCDNLIKIELPANVKSIENAFRGCDSLETVILNDGIEDISGAFEYAPIETITIPSSVTSMDSAFCDCRNLKNVTLAEGITEVSEYAFWSCQNLKTVNLPKSLIEIKKSAFKDKIGRAHV